MTAAIIVDGVSKKFKLTTERHTSLKERVLHAGEQSWLAGDRDRSRTLLTRALESATTSDARARAETGAARISSSEEFS